MTRMAVKMLSLFKQKYINLWFIFITQACSYGNDNLQKHTYCIFEFELECYVNKHILVLIFSVRVNEW